jgi:hypothetical protein
MVGSTLRWKSNNRQRVSSENLLQLGIGELAGTAPAAAAFKEA